MKKESSKKKWVIIIIIIIILLIIAGVVIFFLMNKSGGGSGFGFNGFDFSSATKALNSIGEASNKNTFDNTKLNPFVNGTG